MEIILFNKLHIFDKLLMSIGPSTPEIKMKELSFLEI